MWQNAYWFISQERHAFMIINIAVKDLLWNGKAENTLSRVKTMILMFKALEFTTLRELVLSLVFTRLLRSVRLDDKWAMTSSVTDIVHLVSGNIWEEGVEISQSFIRLKKPSLHLSLLKFVVKSVKTRFDSSWMISDRLTDSCVLLVLKCRFGVKHVVSLFQAL